MIDFRLGRHALGACAAVAVLAGCGGSQPPVASTLQNPTGSPPKRYSRTFNFTRGGQSFKVPEGVKHLTIVADGALSPRRRRPLIV